MRIDNFDYFYNKELGKKCLILGAAPSIKDINVESFNGIIISVNDMPRIIKNRREVDYFVVSNAGGKEAISPYKDFDFINSFKRTVFLFAHSSLDYVDFNDIENKIKIPWFSFDQRHFDRRPCHKQIDYRFDLKEEQKCCKFIGDITIQEYLQNKYNSDCHYSTGDTTILHALSLAIILGCKKIYIGGVEIPMYYKDYLHYSVDLRRTIQSRGIKFWIKSIVLKALGKEIKSEFYRKYPNILSDFGYLNEVCHNNDIEIYNLAKSSALNKIYNFKYLDHKLM